MTNQFVSNNLSVYSPNISAFVRPVPMPGAVKDALIKKAVNASLACRETKLVFQDEYKTLGAGRILCTSATIGPKGERNTHVLAYSRQETVPGLPSRFVVSLCSQCQGWTGKGACRHAVAVTALLNHALLAERIEFPNEIIHAELSRSSVCWCGARRHSVTVYITGWCGARRHSVTVYITGRGYVVYNLCLAMVDGQECNGGVVV